MKYPIILKNTRELSLQFNVGNTTANRVLHEQQLHPYNIQQVQALLPRDNPRRVQFCQWFIKKYASLNILYEMFLPMKLNLQPLLTYIIRTYGLMKTNMALLRVV